MIFVILFWVSVLCILHTYLFYPLIIQLLSYFFKYKPAPYESTDELPYIAVLMAAYNEEAVIDEKIRSIINTNYPREKIKIYIGSDASTDKTDDIIKGYQEYNKLFFKRFDTRQGKPNIINYLAGEAEGEVLVITDANVMFEPETLSQLIKSFKDESVGLVDTFMINKEHQAAGISFQEKTYIAREVRVKYHESFSFGCMMGPFGGCFAVRKNLFEPIPENYLVDDFYINMKVFEQDRKAINNLNARVYEKVSNNLKEEIRRKIRISTGNFQNLIHFRHILLKFNIISFSFLSHKVLRWFGPVFLLLALFSNALIIHRHYFYFFSFLAQVILLLLPFIDLILRKIEIHIIILRFITHFYSMNLALFIGLIKYIRGVKTNVWQPTRRHQ